MATGTGPLGGPSSGGIETSRATPGADLSTGAAEAFSALANLGRTIQEDVVQPKLNEIAAQKGAKEGAALADGKAAPKFLTIGEAGQARSRALEAAYMASTRNQIDAHLADARRANAYDPEAYDAASKKIISGFIQGAPPKFAVGVEAYAQDRALTHMQAVASERVQRDQQEVVLSLNAREAALSERIVDRVSVPGGEVTPEYFSDLHEYQALQAEKMHNPAIAFTPEQAAAATDKLLDAVQGALVTRNVVSDYTAAGRGLPGRAAALKKLTDEYENPQGAFADVSPDRRLKLFNGAKKELDAVYAGDRELQRAEEADAREKRAEASARRGELMLGVVTGAVDIKTIQADTTIDDAAKASLINAARAAARSEAAAARSAAATERLGRATAYRELSDQAAAGELDNEDVAAHVASGILGAGQARTLATKNDKALKPIIDGVMQPYADKAKAAPYAATGVQRMKAEEEGVRWARMNPHAPIDEQLRVGKMIADKYFGGAPVPKSETDDKRGRAAQLAALDADRKAGRLTPAQFNEKRRALLRPN